MTTDAKVAAGTDFMEGVKVDTPAGVGLFREGVVLSDPDTAAARVPIVNAQPGAPVYGLPVWVQGTVAISGNMGRTWNLAFANDKVDASGSSVSVSNFPAGFAIVGNVEVMNDAGNPLPVSGAFFQATQPVSAAALPLPAGASTEATLALVKAKTDNLDVALSTRATEATLATVATTEAALLAAIGTAGIAAPAAATVLDRLYQLGQKVDAQSKVIATEASMQKLLAALKPTPKSYSTLLHGR